MFQIGNLFTFFTKHFLSSEKISFNGNDKMRFVQGDVDDWFNVVTITPLRGIKGVAFP